MQQLIDSHCFRWILSRPAGEFISQLTHSIWINIQHRRKLQFKLKQQLNMATNEMRETNDAVQKNTLNRKTTILLYVGTQAIQELISMKQTNEKIKIWFIHWHR